MRRITAKYSGRCQYQHLSRCKGVKAGESVMFERGEGVWHPGCGPTGVDHAGDREYMQGMVEADRYRFNRQMFGEAYAAAEEAAWDSKMGYD